MQVISTTGLKLAVKHLQTVIAKYCIADLLYKTLPIILFLIALNTYKLGTNLLRGLLI